MNIAIASYAFHGLLERGMIDLFGYLESCRYRYQLDTADIWNGMLASTEDGYLEKVKKGLTSRDLTLVNLCVDGAHVWEPDPDRREQNYQNALAHLHAAEVLGARTVRIDAGGLDPAWSEEQFDWIVRRYSEYAERAYNNGYRVGPENHWGAEVNPENMIRLAQAISHPGFGVLLHIKEEGTQLIAPWAIHTHIAWNITEDDLEGKLNLLRQAGYRGCWSVEHHSGEHEYERVAIQLAKVREVIGRWESA